MKVAWIKGAVTAFALSSLMGATAAHAEELLDNGATTRAWGGGNETLGQFTRGFLLDYGSIAAGSGRTVSGINIAGGWTVYQQFDVPAGPGWHIDSIGVDGWLVTNPAGVLQSGTICADVGGNTANCNVTFGSAKHMMGNDPFGSNWADAAYNVNLAPGRYWYRSSSQDANYWAAIFPGVAGPGSYSINTVNGQRFNAGVTALRISGNVIPEPGCLALLAAGMLVAGGRRRR